MRRALPIGPCVLTLLIAGCGTGAAEDDVASTVARFQSALAQRDGAAACAELTAATRAAVASQEEASCARAVLGLDLSGGGEVTRSDVYVTSGYAEIAGHGAAFLDETAAGWRIGAIGCRPTEPEKPYECELER